MFPVSMALPTGSSMERSALFQLRLLNQGMALCILSTTQLWILRMPIPEALPVGSDPAEIRMDSMGFVVTDFKKCYMLYLPLKELQYS